MPNEAPTQATLASLRKPLTQEEQLPAVRAGFDDLRGFELMQRQCKALAASTLVPQQFQNNVPNCLIALEMAQRIGASPLMVMQNLYVVHGRPGWSAKFLIASFNQCGRFSAIRFRWQGEGKGDDWGCRAYATERENGKEIQGPLITIGLAKKEGWHQKNGSKWQTIPELMLQYRAAAWMVNTHAPEISMGLNTAEELNDVYDAAKASDGTFQVTTAELQAETEPSPAQSVTADPSPSSPAAGAAPSGGLTVEAAVARINAMQDADTMSLWLDDLPEEIKSHADVKAAFRTRSEALREAQGRKPRK